MAERIVIEASVDARVLGLRLLTLDARVVATPAERYAPIAPVGHRLADARALLNGRERASSASSRRARSSAG